MAQRSRKVALLVPGHWLPRVMLQAVGGLGPAFPQMVGPMGGGLLLGLFGLLGSSGVP